MRLSEERLLRLRILSHTGDKIHIKLPVGFVKKMIKNKSFARFGKAKSKDCMPWEKPQEPSAFTARAAVP